MTAADRFWVKVAEGEGGCWVWTGSLNRYGYGRFFNGQKAVYAHRWAYAFMAADVPPGLDLDHLCRNRACVNPDHLDPVSRRINLLRGDTLTARHARKTHCHRGHEFTAENTRIRPGGRECKTCQRQLARARKARRAA